MALIKIDDITASDGQIDPSQVGSPTPSVNTKDPFIFIPSGKGMRTVANPAYRAQQTLDTKIATKESDIQAEVNQSALTSQYNLNLSVESLRDYSKLLAQSWREGGAGNIIKGLKTKAAMKGIPIGDVNQYKTSGALPGKLVEIVSKTFPMLTQQIGKEGSVRLIESVFSKLGASYPNADTPPELAPEQIKQSILSMYRINRAMQNLNLKDFSLNNEAGQQGFINRVAAETNNIEFSPEEQKIYDALTHKVIAPIEAQLELNRRAALKKGKK